MSVVVGPTMASIDWLNSLDGQLWPPPSTIRNSTGASSGQSKVRRITSSLTRSSWADPTSQPSSAAQSRTVSG